MGLGACPACSWCFQCEQVPALLCCLLMGGIPQAWPPALCWLHLGRGGHALTFSVLQGAPSSQVTPCHAEVTHQCGLHPVWGAGVTGQWPDSSPTKRQRGDNGSPLRSDLWQGCDHPSTGSPSSPLFSPHPPHSVLQSLTQPFPKLVAHLYNRSLTHTSL